MPFLGWARAERPDNGKKDGEQQSSAAEAALSRRGASPWLPVCANSSCSTSRLRLWRARQTPIFEGGWLCGPRCTAARIRAAVLRELKGRDEQAFVHRHRVPLGLLLLSQGEISKEQLRAALARQKISGGRVGFWLMREQGIEERVVTRALGAQWGCPVLSIEGHSPENVAGLAPRLLVDAFGFLPLRRAGATLLYVGFEDRIDRCVGLAIERMNGLRVESGIVSGSQYAGAHRKMLAAGFPGARLVEAAGVDALAGALARIVEEAQPVEAKLVRMHEYFWLRLWKTMGSSLPAGDRTSPRSGDVEDVLGSLAGSRA